MDFDKTQCITVGTFRKTGAWMEEQPAVLPNYVASSGDKQMQSNKSLKSDHHGRSQIRLGPIIEASTDSVPVARGE